MCLPYTYLNFRGILLVTGVKKLITLHCQFRGSVGNGLFQLIVMNFIFVYPLRNIPPRVTAFISVLGSVQPVDIRQEHQAYLSNYSGNNYDTLVPQLV